MKKIINKEVLFLLLRAVIFTLAVCGPHLYTLFSQGPTSPNMYSEQDEPYYTSLTYSYGKKSLKESVSNAATQRETPGILSFQTPQEGVELFLGKVAAGLSLTPSLFCLTLDLLCSFSSYLLFALAFRALSHKPFCAEIGAVVMLAWPWSFSSFLSFDPKSTLSLWNNTFITTTDFLPWSCLPVLRGPNTQVSYVLWGASLLLFKRSIEERFASLYTPFFCGVLSGLLLYCYVFAWMVMGALLSCFTIGIAITSGWKLFLGRQWIGAVKKKILIVLLGSFLLTSIPGVAIIVSLQSWLRTIFLFSPKDPSVFFFSPLLVLLMIFCLWRISRNTEPYKLRLDYSIVLVCVVFILLYNLQGISRSYLQVFHFYALYLGPLLSGLITLSVVNLLPWSKLFLRAVWGLCLIAGGMIDQESLWGRVLHKGGWWSEFSEATRFLTDLNKEKTPLVVSSSRWPLFIQNAVQLSGGFEVLPAVPFNNFFASKTDGIKRTLAVQYLLEGSFSPQEAASVLSDETLDEPGKVLSDTSWFATKVKDDAMNEMATILQEINECDIANVLPVRYLVVEGREPLTAEINRGVFVLTPLWRSKRGFFQVIELTQSSESCRMHPINKHTSAGGSFYERIP